MPREDFSLPPLLESEQGFALGGACEDLLIFHDFYQLLATFGAADHQYSD